MRFKKSIFASGPTMPIAGIVRNARSRRPTEAERTYVRARARQAAKTMFDEEQRRGTAAPEEEATCE
jgi:hypothetical protein